MRWVWRGLRLLGLTGAVASNGRQDRLRQKDVDESADVWTNPVRLQTSLRTSRSSPTSCAKTSFNYLLTEAEFLSETGSTLRGHK